MRTYVSASLAGLAVCFAGLSFEYLTRDRDTGEFVFAGAVSAFVLIILVCIWFQECNRAEAARYQKEGGWLMFSMSDQGQRALLLNILRLLVWGLVIWAATFQIADYNLVINFRGTNVAMAALVIAVVTELLRRAVMRGEATFLRADALQEVVARLDTVQARLDALSQPNPGS